MHNKRIIVSDNDRPVMKVGRGIPIRLSVTTIQALKDTISGGLVLHESVIRDRNVTGF